MAGHETCSSSGVSDSKPGAEDLRSRSMNLVERVHDRAVFGRRVRVLADHLATMIPSGARVLDVGCGDGSVATRVMETRTDVEIVGIDVLVRPRTHISVQQFDGTTIPYDDDSFDATTFVDVLHHTADPTVLLAEAARVAKVIVIKDHLAEGFLARQTLRAMDWVGNASHGVVLPYNYWTRARWTSAFEHLGLRIDAEEAELGLYPTPASLVFERRLHVVWRLVPKEPTGS